jgi:probable phosphomutase (TIGR03848 family)
VPKIYLVRHGRTSANKKGILAGRTKGISLDDIGIEQAQKVGQYLENINFAKILVSPMQRCQETAKLIKGFNKNKFNIHTEPGVNECDYGDWSNKKLMILRKKSLWKTIQERPSLVTFPKGESMIEMLNRFRLSVKNESTRLKDKDNILVVSHGDPIRSFIADCLGMHLDNFQRINIDPCSISIINFNSESVQVLTTNHRLGENKLNSSSTLGGGKG